MSTNEKNQMVSDGWWIIEDEEDGDRQVVHVSDGLVSWVCSVQMDEQSELVGWRWVRRLDLFEEVERGGSDG